MTGALLLVLLAGAQDPDLAGLRAAALARAVDDLPRAGPETWDGRWEELDDLPDELKADYGRALRAYRAQDLPLALHHLQVLLDAHPDFPGALHQLGVVCFRLHRHGDARAAMQRFLVHAPQHVGRTRVLAHALYGLGRYGAARDHYRRVLAVRPDDVEARFGDALAAWRLGAEEQAAAGLEAVLAAQPEHADAAYWRALAAFEGGRGAPEEWLAAAERAARLAPFDPRPVYLRAQVLFELGRNEEGAALRARFDQLDRIGRELRVLEGRLLLEPDRVDHWRAVVRLRAALGDLAGLRRARAALARAQAAGGR